ncbi:hypothetical protein NA57DRAFT_77422 [Rhizodiscina lignyota]|uniref:Uncharacterized protein n=1 Tax=Rhizodiscina lignyota TaxID=1504668 RepID=A0A9P4M4Q5_9PEZI|nr:hypothetical protein NA57DRAFT_77422 [Rhizodiscina lignyota]
MSNFKTILIPAVFALSLYLLLTYVLLPLWRRHRQRYAQYLPLHSALDFDNISTSTNSFRARLQDALASFFLPPSIRARWRRSRVVDGSGMRGAGDNGDDDIIGEDEGEDLVNLSGIEAARREALEARRSELERIRRGGEFSDRRLSRDLEEGFMDSSDEEDAGEIEGRGDRAGRERWRNG